MPSYLCRYTLAFDNERFVETADRKQVVRILTKQLENEHPDGYLKDVEVYEINADGEILEKCAESHMTYTPRSPNV